MSENSGWVKYAVVGIIVVIAIVAALILLGIVELPERGGDGAVGTTQQQPQSNPFFGFIPVAIVAIIALFLVKFLHKKKEESGTIPSGAQQPPPQEGRVDLVIEPPQWANFEFSGSKEQKFTYKVTNRTPKELKEVDVAFNYQEKDDEKFSVVRNARTQINLVPAGGTAEGEFYIKSTVPANKWVAEQTGIHAYVWWRDEVGQPWRTDYAAVGLSWDSPTPVPQTPLKLKIRPVSGSPIGITFQEGDAAKDVEFEIINEGIDDVKNCELRIAADAAFLGISNGGVFTIDLINGGGGNKTGQFSVKPTVLSGKLSNLVETAFTCVVFKSHGSTEQISNIVSVPVVLVAKPQPEAQLELQLNPSNLTFTQGLATGIINWTVRNNSNADYDDCYVFFKIYDKSLCTFRDDALVPVKLLKGKDTDSGTQIVDAALPLERWKPGMQTRIKAVVVQIKGTSKKILSLPEEVDIAFVPEEKLPPPSDEIYLEVIPHLLKFSEKEPTIRINYVARNKGERSAVDCNLWILEQRKDTACRPDVGRKIKLGTIEKGGSKQGSFNMQTITKEWEGASPFICVVAFSTGDKKKASNRVPLDAMWGEKAPVLLDLEVRPVHISYTTKSADKSEIVTYILTNKSNADIEDCALFIIPSTKQDICKIYDNVTKDELFKGPQGYYMRIGKIKKGRPVTREFKFSSVPRTWADEMRMSFGNHAEGIIKGGAVRSSPAILTVKWEKPAEVIPPPPPLPEENIVELKIRPNKGIFTPNKREIPLTYEIINYTKKELTDCKLRFAAVERSDLYEMDPSPVPISSIKAGSSSGDVSFTLKTNMQPNAWQNTSSKIPFIVDYKSEGISKTTNIEEISILWSKVLTFSGTVEDGHGNKLKDVLVGLMRTADKQFENWPRNITGVTIVKDVKTREDGTFHLVIGPTDIKNEWIDKDGKISLELIAWKNAFNLERSPEYKRKYELGDIETANLKLRKVVRVQKQVTAPIRIDAGYVYLYKNGEKAEGAFVNAAREWPNATIAVLSERRAAIENSAFEIINVDVAKPASELATAIKVKILDLPITEKRIIFWDFNDIKYLNLLISILSKIKRERKIGLIIAPPSNLFGPIWDNLPEEFKGRGTEQVIKRFER